MTSARTTLIYYDDCGHRDGLPIPAGQPPQPPVPSAATLAKYVSANLGGSLGGEAASFGAGAVSGMVGISVVYPIDVVKTRLQSATAAAAVQLQLQGPSVAVAVDQRRNAFSVARSIFLTESIGSFYKGLLPQLAGTVPDKAASLYARDSMRNAHADPDSWRAICTGAAGAGVVQSAITSPVELIKVRMQVDSANTVAGVVRTLGGRGLYRGFSACLGRDVAFSSTYFTLYEVAKRKLDVTSDGSSPVALRLVAATAAGVPAAFLTTPLDVIKTRMQGSGRRRTTVQMVRDVAAEGGVGAFFKGWGPRVARIAPQFGIVLVMYDDLMDRLRTLT